MNLSSKKVNKVFKQEVSKAKSIIAIYCLIDRFFWKNKLGPIIAFAFPFFVVLLTYIVDLSNDDPYYFFASSNKLIVPISAIPLSIFTLPLLLVEIKRSILLKKIALARISAITYIVIMGSFFMFLSILSVILSEVYWMMFMNTHLYLYFNIKDGLSVFYSVLVLILVSVSMGLLIGCTLKNSSPIPILGLAILFISFILSATIVSPSYLANVVAIKYINLFSPLNYPLTLINITYYNLTNSYHNIFDISQTFNIGESFIPYKTPTNFWEFLIDYLGSAKTVQWYVEWQKILGLVMPWVIVGFFILISVRFFTWSSR